MRLKYLFAGAILSGALFLSGCCSTAISDRNSRTVSVDDFKVNVYNKYKQKDNDSFTGLQFDDGIKVIQVYEDFDYKVSKKAVVEYYESTIPEPYDSVSDIETEDCVTEGGVEYSVITYDAVKSGKEVCGIFDIAYSEGSVLIAAGTCEMEYKDDLKYDMDQMAGTIKYTGEQQSSAEYPVVVENEDFKLTVPEGFAGKINANGVSYTYAANDDYEVGTVSKLNVYKLEDKSDLSEAWKKFSDSELYDNVKKEEMTVGDLFTNMTGEIASVKMVRFTADMKRVDGYIEKCYFEYNGNLYEIAGMIPYDETADKDMHAVQLEIKQGMQNETIPKRE